MSSSRSLIQALGRVSGWKGLPSKIDRLMMLILFCVVGVVAPSRLQAQNITLSPNVPVSFGQVNVGASVKQNVSFIINAPLTLSSVQATGDYSVQSNTCALNTALAANTTCTLQVQFTPSAPGWRNFPLLVTAVSYNSVALALQGFGVGSAVAFTPGILSTFAGNSTVTANTGECSGTNGLNGPATGYAFSFYVGQIAFDLIGNLYIADSQCSMIFKVDTSGNISTVAGTGTEGWNGDNQLATSAELWGPSGVAVDNLGNLYIADDFNFRVRKVDVNGMITTVAGTGTRGYTGDNGPATEAELLNPGAVALDSTGNLYIADAGNYIRKVDVHGTITTIAGTGICCSSGDNGPAVDALIAPATIAVDSAGNVGFPDSYFNRVRVVNTQATTITVAGVSIAAGDIATVAGTGVLGFTGDDHQATSAELSNPMGLAFDNAGNLYISDSDNFRIRKVDPSGTITTVAGNGLQGYTGDNGPATSGEFGVPTDLAVDNAGKIYVWDYNNWVIRKVDVSTSAMSFSSVSINQTSSPLSVEVSDVGTAPLNFTSFAASTNFQLQTVGGDCTTGNPLAVGTTCTLGAVFAPTVAGSPLTGTLTVTDDAFSSPQSVNLIGTTQALPATSLVVSSISSTLGSTVSLTATLTSAGVGISGELITFTLNGTVQGTGYTNSSGVATLSFFLSQLNVGSYPNYIGASFAGDANYASSNGTGNLTVIQGTTSINVMPASGPYAGTVNLTATLTSGGVGVSNQAIAFSLNGNPVGTQSTNSLGTATLNAIPLAGSTPGSWLIPGSYPISASFLGNANYASSAGSGTLAVTQAPTSVTVITPPAVSVRLVAQSVNLTATVTSPAGTVNEGTVSFSLWNTSVTPMQAIGGGTGAVSNGSTTVSVVLPGGTAGNLQIFAQYADCCGTFNITNSLFAESNDDTHYLSVVSLISDVAISSISIPPFPGEGAIAQPIDPQSIIVDVNVCNLSGQTAEDVTVQLSWTNLITGSQGSFAPYYVGELVSTPTFYNPRTCGDATFTWSNGAAALEFQAYVYSASTDSNPANNQGGMELNGLYYTVENSSYASTTLSNYTFRIDRDAFSFPNIATSGTSDINWQLFEDTFGSNNVDDEVSILGIDVGTIHSPIAQLFYDFVYSKWFEGSCFGMSALSLDDWEQAAFRENFGVPTTYSDPEPAFNPGTQVYSTSNPDWLNIEVFQGSELGAQVLTQEVNNYQTSVTTTLNALEAQMAGPSGGSSPNPNMLVMLNESALQGHVDVPYRIVATTCSLNCGTLGTHQADIYVYENYCPYGISASTLPSNSINMCTTNSASPAIHAVHLNLDQNTWSYPDEGYPGPYSNGLMWVPTSLIQTPPTLPYKSAYLDGFFVDQGFTAGMLALQRVFDKALGTVWNFITSIFGQASSPTSPQAPQGYLLLSGYPYQATLTGTGTSGPANAIWLKASSGLKFTSQTITPTTQDTITFSPDGTTAVLGTTAANEQYAATLFGDLGTAVREYTVSNTSMAAGETITLTVINGGAAFQITNQGNPKTYNLTLQQVGAGQSQISFTGLNMGANETDIFTPSDWTNLGTAPVSLQIQNSSGTTSGTVTAPAITSASSATFAYGTTGTFVVVATGFPNPALAETGTLPNGFSFNPSTGLLSGTPASGSEGTYNITFTATNGAGSTSQSFQLTVNRTSPTVTFTGAPTSAVYGSTFPVTATTNASTTATTVATGSCSITGNVVTMTSGVGTCGLTANWAADSNYVAATANQSTLALKAASTATIISNTPNPSAPGQAVVVNYQVVGNGSPSGTVSVAASTGEICSGSLSASTGNCSLTFVTVGPRTLTASYAGDTNFNGSVSAGVSQSVIGPLASLTPASVNFGNVYLGLPAAQLVTLTNVGNAAMSVGKVLVSGGNDSEDFFALSVCPAALPAGKSCQIAIGFLAAPGNYNPTAVLSVNDNALGTPQTVPLSATVINPIPSLSSYSLTYGKQKIGTTSAAQQVTVTNIGTTSLVLSTLTVSGDFAVAAGTTCASGETLAPTQSCVVELTFTPSAKGSRQGSLVIKDNALINEQIVLLFGTGI